MPINLGIDDTVGEVYVGTESIGQIYVGTELVWSKSSGTAITELRLYAGNGFGGGVLTSISHLGVNQNWVFGEGDGLIGAIGLRFTSQADRNTFMNDVLGVATPGAQGNFSSSVSLIFSDGTNGFTITTRGYLTNTNFVASSAGVTASEVVVGGMIDTGGFNDMTALVTADASNITGSYVHANNGDFTVTT